MSCDEGPHVVPLPADGVMDLRCHGVIAGQGRVDGESTELADPSVAVEDLEPDALLEARAASSPAVSSYPWTTHIELMMWSNRCTGQPLWL